MFKNYLKIAFRNFKKHRSYSFINIFGFAVGLSCSILIVLFILNELSYDRYHENADRIYRVTRLWYNEAGAVNMHLGHIAPPIGPLLANDFEEVANTVRMRHVDGVLLHHGNRHFEEHRFFFAEADLFKIFSFDVLQGDPTILQQPNTLVITKSTAIKYFGNTDPLGQTIGFDFRGIKKDFKVGCVIYDMPQNSHFHVDFLASFKTLEMVVGEAELRNWMSNDYATYLLMKENADINAFKAQLDPFIERHYIKGRHLRTRLNLQPLTDIHLHSHLDSEIEANGNITSVIIFSVIAVFILLIACVNFINLSTARASVRAHEVGMRKIVGAYRKQLINQFITESVVMALIALIFAFGIVSLVLHPFNNFLQHELSLIKLFDLPIAGMVLGITLLVGFLAGTYPAFFLSAFQPLAVLKKSFFRKAPGVSLRSILVIFQFAISIILVVCVGVVGSQLSFIQNKSLGYNKENVVLLPSSPLITSRLETVKQELLRHPNILKLSAAKRVPSGRLLDSAKARIIGERETPVNFMIAMLRVDHDYIPTFGMKMASGRNFRRDMPTDATKAFIINETAVKQLGMTAEQVVGKGFEYGAQKGFIIGVVKDFHFESLHQSIAPMVMKISSHSLNQIAIRIKGNIPKTMAFLQKQWKKYRSNYPFTYEFIDERLARQYTSEMKLRKLFLLFSLIGIVIACLGLLGLSIYSAERRFKEIGIRKVLGATVPGIILLISRGFTKWVLVANLIAWPAAYFVMNMWLKNFAYRITISIWIFILSGLIAFSIALLTVSYQSIRAATANPVEALRYE